MLVEFGIDSKTTHDDCVVIFPVSKIEYVDNYPPLRYLHQMHVNPHSQTGFACSASESCKSVAEGPALPKLVSLAMRGRCRFVRGDDSGGGEGDKWTRLNRGELGKEIVPGEGVGDAEGVEGVDEALYGQSGVLCPALDVSPAMRKRFNKKCLDPVCVGH